jgi:hypothetical protein
VWLSLPGLVIVFGVFGGVEKKRRSRARFVLLLLLALMVPSLWLEVACGSGLQGNGTGNGQGGTPSGTYTLTVSATISSLPQQTAQVQLTVN